MCIDGENKLSCTSFQAVYLTLLCTDLLQPIIQGTVVAVLVPAIGQAENDSIALFLFHHLASNALKVTKRHVNNKSFCTATFQSQIT